jgi:DNA-binding IclR family transcriptional regulator
MLDDNGIASKWESPEQKSYILRNVLNNSKDDRIDMLQIQRASKVLICIINGINTLSEVADYCEVSKSSMHRLLRALERSKFIIYDPFSRQYMIGELINNVAAKSENAHHYLATCARKELERVADITGETVLLGVLAGTLPVCVRFINSRFQLRVVDDTSNLPTLRAGAASYVLLSQLADEELAYIFKQFKKDTSDETPIPEFENWMAKIRQVREKGYAVSQNEKIVGAMGISVPIRNYCLPATITLLGLEIRMKENKNSYVDLMVTNADRISLNLKNYFQSDN